MSTSASSVNRTPVSVSTAALSLLCACFVLSGFAALVYQTAWTRQFAIVFGTSELAVATVLAAYMGGLALGAVLAEKFLPRVTRPVFTYAIIELGIAVSAVFVVPALLWLANLGLQSLFGGQDAPPSSEQAGTTLFYLASSFVALALPTTLMGATLPMLARYAVAEEKQIGRRIGVLYAMNTAGAVGGALLTAFALLPELGLTRTVWFAAAVNGLVFILAVMLAKRVPFSPPPRGYDKETPAPAPRVQPARIEGYSFNRLPSPAWVLPLMLLAGAVAFFQEVLWTRMLSHIVGSSIYAFGVMVASFLVGIALGGGIGALIARTRERAAAALGIALILAAFAAVLAWSLLEWKLPQTAGLMRKATELAGLQLSNTLLSGLLLLPMTVAIGTTYPLAVRVLAADAGDAARASARVYAWNTVGAIVGALAAGFLLIPAFKYEGSIRLAVLASAVLGIFALWVLVPVYRVLAVASMLVAAACLFFRPQPPMKLLVTSPLNVGTEGRVLTYDIGRSASVVMMTGDGGLALRTNGLPEALMDGPGALPRFSGEFWLSPLAVIARPQARDMLIVGFGGGVVVEGVPPSVARVDVIELEPKVLDANRKTSALRKRDPFADTRMTPIVNDARGALRLTARRYDAIVSQPSHPWTAGASHLYTREFMELAHQHLNDDGVFVQWMNVIFMDADLLRSLTATLCDVFKHVRVYRPDPNTVIFLASDAPLDLERQVARTGLPLREAPLHYARYGINNVEDLVTALVLDNESARRFSAGSPLITDDDNRIATSSVYERDRGMNADSAGRVLAAEDPLQRSDSFLYTEMRDSLSFPYIARRAGVFVLLDPSLLDRLRRMSENLGASADGEYVRSFYFRSRREGQRATERLRLGVGEYPADEALRQELLRGWIPTLVRDDVPPELREIAAGLRSPYSLAVLDAARHASKSDWQGVAMTDARLAEIPWTDAWYPEAIELRIHWRTRVTSPEQKVRFAEEALAFIDRSALMGPTLGLYGFRMRAGFTVRRPDIVLESVFVYAKLAAGMTRSGVNPPDSLRNDAKALGSMLDDAAKLPGIDTARLAEVRAEVAKLNSIP
jgi:spermidine synthase